MTEDDGQEDPEALLNAWLGELDTLTMGLDKTSNASLSPMRPLSSDLNGPRIDSFRLSMANMEDTQDVDLDAILGELCALESQYEEAIQTSTKTNEARKDTGRRLSGSTRTHSPDNDSAFSDSVSLLSSESSASSGRNEISQIDNIGAATKAEKIRLAMQKIKEASVKKIFIKVFNDDGSVKSLLVDESMTCGYITRLLAEKNHQPFDQYSSLVEFLPELHMERVYEEHEILVTELMRWSYWSKNRLHFTRRPERNLLFTSPQLVTGIHVEVSRSASSVDVLEEFFSGAGVPSVEGPLYIKSDSKKGWKRYHCILRSSGLYYWPKEKAKSSSKDLVCLATFDVNHVYYGVGWKKRFKAPTDYCFGLKHPSLQEPPKSGKYIRCLCAEDQVSLHRWVTAIRVAKFGRQLLDNYRQIIDIPPPPIPASILSSAGSDSGSSSGVDAGFEAETFPSGTIKRKPAKIPLTSTTRALKSNAIGEDEFYDLPPPPPELLTDCPVPSEIGIVETDPAFLQDLHRVVRSKWQVAQKCKLESLSPHQVLGFRYYDSKVETTQQWVEDHYGGSQGMKKIPPPPPPRAVTTVLTSVPRR